MSDYWRRINYVARFIEAPFWHPFLSRNAENDVRLQRYILTRAGQPSITPPFPSRLCLAAPIRAEAQDTETSIIHRVTRHPKCQRSKFEINKLAPNFAQRVFSWAFGWAQGAHPNASAYGWGNWGVRSSAPPPQRGPRGQSSQKILKFWHDLHEKLDDKKKFMW